MFCLILLVLLFSRRHYWGCYGYPNAGYGYGGYGSYGYPYGAYSAYNPYFRRGYGYYGGYRPYGYW